MNTEEKEKEKLKGGKGERVQFGFISSFMSEGEKLGLSANWRETENGATLNYNPLRDTAEFAFKIKRAQVVLACSI